MYRSLFNAGVIDEPFEELDGLLQIGGVEKLIGLVSLFDTAWA